MKTIPPAIVGPGPLIDAPFAGTPFTVWKSLFVSNSHNSEPSFVDQPRTPPSFDPVKTTPGMTVIAARIAALQPRLPAAHLVGGGGANQVRFPVARLTACRPPGASEPMVSDTAKYALSLSTADPNSSPPSALPFPAWYCHRIAPCLSGSNAHPMPDFWPATMMSLPSARVMRMGALPKSWSGPSSPCAGQLPAPA